MHIPEINVVISEDDWPNLRLLCHLVLPDTELEYELRRYLMSRLLHDLRLVAAYNILDAVGYKEGYRSY
jgi:hypothetical protein